MSGCKAVVCSQPDDLAGYVVDNVNLDLSVGQFEVHAECAVGYEGVASALPCTSTGNYTLAGCTEIVFCRSPTDVTGYIITEEADLLGAPVLHS